MAGRKRHSAEDIVRKLRRADELAAEGKSGEEIAAELGVSAATLYNWRRALIRRRAANFDDRHRRLPAAIADYRRPRIISSTTRLPRN